LALATAGGLRWEHLAADGVLMVMPWVGPKSLAFVRAALPLWITGVFFDNQRYLPLLGHVHTGDILQLEISLFPAPGQISWPQWFDLHHTAALDLICGFAYATYLLELFVVAGYFYLRREPRLFSALAWSFFAANLIGLVTYVFFPVAPPWYVISHGVANPDPHALGSAAGCARFDELLGINYFRGFYARNPNVMGAMPSLHVAYPVLVAWYTWRRGWAWRVGALTFVAWVGFAAVYLVHHYLLDVIAGFAIAIACCLWASWLVGRWPGEKRAAIRTA
jgi:membrane-associated phospholipid phosphatase